MQHDSTIWVDRGDGKGFAFLAADTVPDYTDTAAMPPAGQSALWKYKPSTCKVTTAWVNGATSSASRWQDELNR